MSKKTLTFNRVLQASPASVYTLFTTAMGLREWLSDNAQAAGTAGGRIYLHWNMGYHAMGFYKELIPNEKIAFSWQGFGDAHPTDVVVTLAEKEGSTVLNLEHSGMGEGEAWDQLIPQMESSWNESLENLQSILEEGIDLRIARRPMLGVLPTALVDDKMAALLGVPVHYGVRISGTVAGSGAEAAGLQADDVIVRLDQTRMDNFNAFAVAVGPHRAGDQIEVEFYRGPEKHIRPLTLSSRQFPDLAPTAAALAEGMEQAITKLHDELDELLAGVTEEEAEFHPAEGEWNVKENLAHLIWSERYLQNLTFNLVGGEDFIPWQNNGPLHLIPTLSIHGSLSEMIEAFKQAQKATVAAAAAIPADFIANQKGAYRRLALNLTGFDAHTRSHYTQMKEALEAARAKVSAQV